MTKNILTERATELAVNLLINGKVASRNDAYKKLVSSGIIASSETFNKAIRLYETSRGRALPIVNLNHKKKVKK